MRICSCASRPSLVRDGWVRRKFSPRLASFLHFGRFHGDGEGEAKIISSATAKIRILYSSFRNNALLYFAIGICNAMYLRHAPECGRFVRLLKNVVVMRRWMRFMSLVRLLATASSLFGHNQQYQCIWNQSYLPAYASIFDRVCIFWSNCSRISRSRVSFVTLSLSFSEQLNSHTPSSDRYPNL